MIRRKDECKIEYREHMRGGDGTAKVTSFITGADELCGKGRVFSRITLEPGCSIGYHVHEGDIEFFYILTGTGVYSDNGELVTVHAGDVAICEEGHGHSMSNQSNEVLEMIALVVYR